MLAINLIGPIAAKSPALYDPVLASGMVALATLGIFTTPASISSHTRTVRARCGAVRRLLLRI